MNEDTLRPCTESAGNVDDLIALANMRMPYGIHKGKLLIDLPEHYVVWMAGEGFPAGKLGEMLRSVYDIKVNGLEYLFEPLRSKFY
ncbi:MAG: DUF3820 family protein [Desulfuromonadaceae bacterium]|nr:DUF3820 family protein [Desulfuromonadaceae bacterium]